MQEQTQELIAGNWNPFSFFTTGAGAFILLMVILFFIFVFFPIFFNGRQVSRMKKGKLFIVVFVLGLFFVGFGSNPVFSQDILYEPISETLDLKIDGSTPTFVNISNNFEYITRLVWTLRFDGDTYKNTNFANSSALSNGVDIFYNDKSLLDGQTLKANNDFSHASCEINVLQDEDSPQSNEILSQWDLETCFAKSLRITTSRTLGVKIQDNLTDLTEIDEFSLFVDGYDITVQSYFWADELYYQNAFNTLQLRYLTTHEDYNVKINSTQTSLLEWVNTTAKSETITLRFFVPLEPDGDNVVSLWLYEGDTFLEQLDLIVNPIQTGLLETFLEFIPYGVFIMLVLGLFFFLTGGTDRIRKR